MLAAALTGVLLGLTAVTALAQPAPAAIEKRAENVLTAAVAGGAAPGVVVAIVLDGEIVHLRGYGFTDTVPTRNMGGSNTLVRLGGVSHVVTAAVALAAAEAGTIRLQQDVHPLWERAGLTVRGPSTVTMQDLLTHYAGFGDRILGQFAPREADWRPLAMYLGGAMPPPVLRPGTATFPSAHALALAGLTLEAAGGLPFPTLASRLVFAPLGMDFTTFEPRLPAPALESLATGHRWAPGGPRPVPYDYPQTFPAVGLVTSARDMAQLLQAILRGGVSPAGTRLWSEESNRLLLTRRATNDASMAGRSYAFVETRVGGRTLWKNDGLANGFSASMAIAPDIGLGVFIAANAGTFRGLGDLSPAGALVRDFAADLIESLWPPVQPAAVPVRKIAPDDRADFGGTYRDATIDGDTPLKFLRLLTSVRVADQSDVRIVVAGEVYQKVGLDLFQNGPRFVKFLRDADGNLTHLLRPNEVLERAPLFETDAIQRGFLAITLALLGAGAFVSLLGLVLRWRGARANVVGFLSAGGGLALMAWFAWQVANFSVGVAFVGGIAGMPFPKLAWLPPLILAPLAFLYALFGIGIRNVNRYSLIGIAIGWAAFYPLLRTWNFLR
jgi:CubicO group peptidase (beta-lactamase class C family)